MKNIISFLARALSRLQQQSGVCVLLRKNRHCHRSGLFVSHCFLTDIQVKTFPVYVSLETIIPCCARHAGDNTNRKKKQSNTNYLLENIFWVISWRKERITISLIEWVLIMWKGCNSNHLTKQKLMTWKSDNSKQNEQSIKLHLLLKNTGWVSWWHEEEGELYCRSHYIKFDEVERGQLQALYKIKVDYKTGTTLNK